jgi:hypothetical protein
MAKVSIAFGVILILLGVGAYGLAAAGVIGDGRASPTALIPAAIGLVLTILGAIGAAKPNLNKHVMHGAVLVGLLGLIGTVGGIVKLIRYATDSLPPDAPVRVSAWVTQSIMAVLMVIFVAMCVRSFIAARRARRLEAAAN